MKRVYLSARYEWAKRMQKAASLLEHEGIEVTSRWIRDNFKGIGVIAAAKMDLEDVERADTLICFADKTHRGGGRHIELGYALALGKKLFVVGASETLFHELLQVHVVKNFDEILYQIRSS